MRKARSLMFWLLLVAVGVLFGVKGDVWAAEIIDSDVTLSQNSYTYDGSSKTPDVTVVSDGTTLVRDKDYDLNYANNVNAGNASATVTGKGAYSGTVTKSFTINKAAQTLKISAPSVSLSISGNAQIACSGNQGTLTYTSANTTVASVSSSGLISANHAGSTTITVTAEQTINYNAASATVSVNVKKNVIDSDNTKVTLSTSTYTYNGKAKTPGATVKYNGKTLTSGTDYTVSYSDNVNAGTPKVNIKGTGDYTGSVSKSFTIKKKKLKLKVTLKKKKVRVGKTLKIKANIPVSYLKYTYSKKNIVTISKKGILTGKHAGTLKITAKAQNLRNYTNSRTTFQVTVLKRTLSSKYYKVKLSKKTYVYDGTAKRPKVTITGTEGTLKKGRDYKVAYSNNTNAGTAKITITGIGDYKGKIKKTFRINKATQTIRATLSKGTIRVGGTTKIKVRKKAGKVSYRSANTAIATVKNGVVRGISAGRTTITVRVAASKNYRAASTTISVTVRKSSLKEAKLKIKISPLYANYTGQPLYPSVVIKDNGKLIREGTDYTLTYLNNVNIGKATIVVKGFGNYYDQVQKNFYITPQNTQIRTANATGGTLTVTWVALNNVDGYQIQYSTDATFNTTKKISVTDPNRTSASVGGLQKGSTYYVRIRTIKNVANDDTYVSDWSDAAAIVSR